MKVPFQVRPRFASLSSTLTPLIDVIFQLLIFFLCTASLGKVESLLPANLPNAGGKTTKAADPLTLDPVRIRLSLEQNRVEYHLGERSIESLEDLSRQLERLAGVSRDILVTLRIDSEVPLESVIEVFDAIRLLGMRRIYFETGNQISAPTMNKPIPPDGVEKLELENKESGP